MLGFQVLLLASLFTIIVIASKQPYSIHKRAPDRHDGWERGPRANPDFIVPVQVDLAETAIDEAAGHLLALADPSSPSFGQYWSAQDVTLAFALPDRDIQAVLLWITNGSGNPPLDPRLSPCRCRVDFNATILQLERLLRTEYYVYKHIGTGNTSLACDQYSLPEQLQPLVDFILPTIFPTRAPPMAVHPISSPYKFDFGGVRTTTASLATRQTRLDCNRFTTPDCLRDWYHIPVRPSDYPVHPNGSFGIFQPAGASWLPEDLDKFFGFFEPLLQGQRPNIERIDGGYYNSKQKNTFFNLEPNLDFEYAMSLAWPQPLTNLQVGDMYLGGNLNHMLAAFDDYYCDALDPAVDAQYPNLEFPDGYQSRDCGTHNAPKVISISYAWDEGRFPPDYLRRQCHEYLKLGLQGITVIAASGDEGTAGRNKTCAADSASRPFRVSFPASCPWVTAVGGTMKNTNLARNETTPKSRETVFTHSFGDGTTNSSSTGGFSNIFTAPEFQTNATASYLAAEADRLAQWNLTTSFNCQGRGIPDVSALAADYVVAIHGRFFRVYGTSSSAPVVASMIAMINNERLLKGKGPVGFVNPVLYRHPEVFVDVTHGENVGCRKDQGFRAVEGWDAATGLGSPDYKRLLDLFLSL